MVYVTFSTKIKDEVTKVDLNRIEMYNELAALIRYDGIIKKDNILITVENASVARRIYKSLKELFMIDVKIIIRIQKRFRVKTVYMLLITEKLELIKKSLYLNEDFLKYLETDEEKSSFLRGAFLACGSINNPSTSGYHFELVFKKSKEATSMLKLLKYYLLSPKKLVRGNSYMVYLKQAEEISDILKIIRATNSLFEFEDVRIYRDHKNMVNRLNNCEIANQEKSYSAAVKQLEEIKYLKENDLLDLLDEKTKIIIKYREKYPDVSFSELADIITMETDYKIGKSGINHHFIKIKNLIEKHQQKMAK